MGGVAMKECLGSEREEPSTGDEKNTTHKIGRAPLMGRATR